MGFRSTITRAQNTESEWKSYFFSYGVLGLGSCFTLVEPAPYEAIGVFLLIFSILRNRAIVSPRHFDEFNAKIFGLVLLFWFFQLSPIVFQTNNISKSLAYAAVTISLMAIGMHLGYLYKSSQSRFKAFIIGYTIAAVFSSLLSIISMIPVIANIGGDILMFAGRPKGLFKDPNVLAPYIIPSVFILLISARNAHGFVRVFLKTLALVCMVGVIVAASRAAWINLATVLLVYFLYSTWRQKIDILKLMLMAITFLFLLVSFFTNYDAVQNIVGLYNTRTTLQDYDSERFSSTEAAFKIGLENPLGVGAGGILFFTKIEPHNTYIKIWSENGQISLIIFSLILCAIAIRGFRLNNNRNQGNMSIILGYALLAGSLINASVIDALHWRHFWVIFGFAMFSSGSCLKTFKQISAN